ncbi:MAG: FkbM family methyltransferase [Actinomycetota bacterium]
MGRGLRISLRRASADYLEGTNELPVQFALRSHLQSGGVFYDIGSNVGFFALIAARLVGRAGHVYAFEPVPLNAACIRANSARNHLPNLEVVEVAVAGTSGRQLLQLSAHPGGAILAAVGTAPDALETLEVEAATLDDLIASGRIQPPTMVKIDVEGAELDVLSGMAATIRSHGPAVICELDDRNQAILERKCHTVASVLNTHGYQVSRLEVSYRLTDWQVAHLLAVPKTTEGE